MKEELLAQLLALQPALAASDVLRDRVTADYIARHDSRRVTDQGVSFDREDRRGLYVPWWHVRTLIAEYGR